MVPEKTVLKLFEPTDRELFRRFIFLLLSMDPRFTIPACLRLRSSTLLFITMRAVPPSPFLREIVPSFEMRVALAAVEPWEKLIPPPDTVKVALLAVAKLSKTTAPAVK